MASEALVEDDIRDGRAVVEVLKEANFPLRAAMWYYAPEYEDWRLLLASRVLKEQGPNRAYARVQRELDSHDTTRDFPLSKIWLVEDNYPLVDTLAKVLRLAREGEVRLTGTRFFDHEVRDAHVYLLERK